MDDQTNEKEFPPTPQKLAEARRKGEIVRSTDLNTAATYLGFLLTLLFVFEGAANDLIEISVSLIEATSRPEEMTNTMHNATALKEVIKYLVIDLLPVFLIPTCITLSLLFGLRGILFSPSKIGLKVNKISPLSGIKNKYGRAGLFEFFKSFLKLNIFILTLAVFIVVNFDKIATATLIPPGAALKNIATLLNTLVLIVFVLTAVIGVFDYSFQYAEHIRKNRMSRKDLEDEMKNAEGDPLVKQRRRQKAMALATNAMMSDMPEASVVIVNPTHFAVALKWDIELATAPIVLAKGKDEVARRIRETATEYNIPIHSDPPTARALFAGSNIGDAIEPQHYEAVAAAIRFADSLRHEQRTAYE